MTTSRKRKDSSGGLGDAAPAAIDALGNLTHWFGLRVEEGTRRQGLTPVRARVVHALGELGPCKQRELAAATYMSTQQLAVIMDWLVDQGIAERTPDPADRRAVRVVLTAAGRERAREIVENRAAVGMQLFEGWGNEELRRLTMDLQRVADRAREPLN